MPPASTKANYKTYEAQARMVRAIVAAHPDVKWNYKGKQFFFFIMLPHILYHLHCSIVGIFCGLGISTFVCLRSAVLDIFLFLLGRRLTLRPRNRRLLWIRHD